MKNSFDFGRRIFDFGFDPTAKFGRLILDLFGVECFDLVDSKKSSLPGEIIHNII